MGECGIIDSTQGERNFEFDGGKTMTIAASWIRKIHNCEELIFISILDDFLYK